MEKWQVDERLGETITCDGLIKSSFFCLLRLTLICCFSGRAALQKRIMALLRQLDSQTAGNFQVLFNLVNFYAL